MSLGVSKQPKWIQLTLFLSLLMVWSKIADALDIWNKKTKLKQKITHGTKHLTKGKTAHGTYLSCLILATIKAMTTTQSL